MNILNKYFTKYEYLTNKKHTSTIKFPNLKKSQYNSSINYFNKIKKNDNKYFNKFLKADKINSFDYNNTKFTDEKLQTNFKKSYVKLIKEGKIIKINNKNLKIKKNKTIVETYLGYYKKYISKININQYENKFQNSYYNVVSLNNIPNTLKIKLKINFKGMIYYCFGSVKVENLIHNLYNYYKDNNKTYKISQIFSQINPNFHSIYHNSNKLFILNINNNKFKKLFDKLKHNNLLSTRVLDEYNVFETYLINPKEEFLFIKLCNLLVPNLKSSKNYGKFKNNFIKIKKAKSKLKFINLVNNSIKLNMNDHCEDNEWESAINKLLRNKNKLKNNKLQVTDFINKKINNFSIGSILQKTRKYDNELDMILKENTKNMIYKIYEE